MRRWVVVLCALTLLAVAGGRVRTVYVPRYATAAQAAVARRYTSELVAYRAEVRRECLPVLRAYRQGRIVPAAARGRGK